MPSRSSWPRKGIRRYGFHGLSYEYIASALPKAAPAIAEGRVVVAHLGNGASLCGHAGRTQHGHHDGVLGARRPADGDAMRRARPGRGAAPAEPGGHDRRRRWRTCSTADPGCSACPGSPPISANCWRAAEPRARFAIEVFIHRVARGIGSLAAALGGLDGLVFTAGVGENAAPVRAMVCEACAWLGVELDAGGQRIACRPHHHGSAAASRPMSSRPTRT